VSELVESFQRILRDQAGRRLILLAGQSRTITAAELWADAQNHVGRLQGLGLVAGDLVVSMTGNRPEAVALLLAARLLGLTLMAVDAGATRAELGALATRFGASALVAPRESTTAEAVSTLDFTAQHGERRPYHQAAMLKLTSGSTGLPHAAVTTEAQLIADGRQIMATMEIGPADTQLAAIPLSHSYGLGVLVMPLLLQGTPIVLREAFVPHQLFADALEGGAKRFPGVPFMFEYLLGPHGAGTPGINDAWPAGLSRLVSAGAPLTPAVSRAFSRRFGVKVHAFYGATETGGIAYDDSNDAEIVETVGRPLDGVTVSLRPENDLPGGRVHVSSPAVSCGYVGSSDDFASQGFLTGDYGTFDAAGRLTLLGRVSSFINVAGRKVQPAEVEATIRGLSGVADVRVVGGHDERRGEHVVACIVPRAEAGPVTAMAVRRFCAERLAPHKVPRAIVFVDAIPLTARGKTDREALRALIRSRTPREP
jgi:acyl-CoA synthetase (AMP-forming)/AMP-acid ligase II